MTEREEYNKKYYAERKERIKRGEIKSYYERNREARLKYAEKYRIKKKLKALSEDVKALEKEGRTPEIGLVAACAAIVSLMVSISLLLRIII